MKEKRKSSTGDAPTPKSGGAKKPKTPSKKAAVEEENDAETPGVLLNLSLIHI